MVTPSLLKVATLALALATPALSCVQFSLNVNSAGMTPAYGPLPKITECLWLTILEQLVISSTRP